MATSSDDRADRLAAALRANLARRKAQARGVAEREAEPDDQRASASDPSDVAAPAA